MKIQKYQWGNPVEEWGSQWKERLQPSGGSKVIQKWNATGKKPKPESSTEKARKQAQPQRTWRSDVADTFHNIGEGVLALSPYTAVPYYGAKVGQDILNGNVGVHTALNASVPLLPYTSKIAQGIVNFVKHPGIFVFDHLPYKTIYNIDRGFKDVGTFFRTPINENPIKAVQNARKLRQGNINPINFNNEEMSIPTNILPNYKGNPINLFRSRYKYMYENNPNLFEQYDPSHGGFVLNGKMPYENNIDFIPIKTYLPFKKVLKNSDNISDGIRNYINFNFDPGFSFSNGNSSFIKINPKHLKDLGFNINDVKVHEMVHSLDNYPSARVGELNFFDTSLLPTDVKKYFLKNNSTELTAKGSQLKNYFGLKGGESITPGMLKYAAKHYVKDTRLDNNMNQMFNAIDDWDSAAQWFSKYSLKNGGNIVQKFKKDYESNKEN